MLAEPKTSIQLLAEFKKQPNALLRGKKLIFDISKNRDVYNITAPFKSNNKYYIAGRVESRKSDFLKHHDEEVIFFYEKNGRWIPERNTPLLRLEDPFISIINKQLIVGGVEIFQTPRRTSFKTVFYRGSALSDLKQFSEGPEEMKDIRLVKLDDCIGVFTRPVIQKNDNYIRKIGFTTIKKLDDLTSEILKTAPCIENQFSENEWGGVNEARLLQDKKIGVIGHIANKDNARNLHYYAMAFIFDPNNFKSTPIKIIATRDNFPEGEIKRPDLKDVVFSGGIVKNAKKKDMVDLYVGLSDAEAGVITIPNPFR